MTARSREQALPINLSIEQLYGLEAEIDCALLADYGEARDRAQESVVAWVYCLSGPEDFTREAMMDAIYGLYGQVLIAMRAREGQIIDQQPNIDNWCAQGLAVVDAEDSDEQRMPFEARSPVVNAALH